MPLVQTIKDQIYEIIKKKILMQEYPPGSKINIGQVSKELGVSNSPIREALNILEHQGLVISTPNTGVSVVSLTQRDHFELSQMLLFWIVGSYEYLLEVHQTDKLYNDMKAILDTQKKCFKDKNIYDFTYYANMFDRCILEKTGNKRLLAKFDQIFPLYFLGSVYDQAEDYKSCVLGLEQHEKILSAIQEERHDDVIIALREHHYKPIWDLRNKANS
ncbi:GntR family transcriptional regulator [Anaerotignum sp.]|uniref:GntR family transcriptional regulator n=1 Tax=Anaerotignum sp. TaxID=2039241 RepID=UPI0027145C29|nr:GntR family transcriptional regulator [Anaerotignum sp.]